MNTLDQIGQKLTQAVKDRDRIERALTPNRTIAETMNLMQSPNIGATTDIAGAMALPSHFAALSQTMTLMQREHRLFTEIANQSCILDEVTKQLVEMHTYSESLTAPYKAFQEMIRSQGSVFKKISANVAAAMGASNFSIPQVSQATLAWSLASNSLVDRMSDIGLLTQRETLSARLFAVPTVFTDFVQHTTGLLAKNPTPDIATRLRGSLNLAEQQLLGITDTINSFITVPADDEDIPDTIYALNAPFSQQRELLNCELVKNEKDIAALTTASPTAQTERRGRRVLELVTKCNAAGKASKFNIEIFKPTTRLMTVFIDLPWLAATDQSQFGNVIDCLYFIFYEGAGKDNLRFLDDHGGPLTISDCDLIWCIKHLRNKWIRHDIDHGKERNIRKSWSEIAEKFRWLGLTEYPTETHHFQQLHLKLLELAEIFLMQILNKITLKQ